MRAGFIGSYARGNWGVGSDLDVVLVLRKSAEPFPQRPLLFNLSKLPIPVDVLVYTVEEWERIIRSTSRFGRELAEANWVFCR